MRFEPKRLVPVLLVLLLVACAPTLGALEVEPLAQAAAAQTPSLRPYWHVFAAYAIAIVLIGGWAISIARRLRDVESRLSGE